MTFTSSGRVVGLLLVWNALIAGNGPAFGDTVNLGMMNDRQIEVVIGGAFLVCGTLGAVGARIVKSVASATR